MLRRLLSHLLIALAVLALTTTFFVWIVDMAVLTPGKLVPALRAGGVPSAIANIIPQVAENGSQDASPKEVADMKAKIASVVTPAYVDQKMQRIIESTTQFIKNGSPQPTLDLSDFPKQLEANGVDVGGDMTKNFVTPIELNKDGKLNALPTAYKDFKMLKYAGVVLCALLLLAEWFVAERGKKLQRVGRIFLHSGLIFLLYELILIVLPTYLTPKLTKAAAKGDANTTVLIEAFVKSVQHLFSSFFLSFAVVSLTIALILYLLRHGHKHVEAINSTPAAPASRKRAPAKA